jgi:hypothetical protein
MIPVKLLKVSPFRCISRIKNTLFIIKNPFVVVSQWGIENNFAAEFVN